MRSAAFLFLLLGLTGIWVTSQEAPKPERLLADVLLLETPEQLKVVAAQTSLIHSTSAGQSQVNMHSYLIYFDGRFWASWSSGPVNSEDSPSQFVRYSTSRDGHHWDESQILVADPDGPDKPGRWLARGIFVQEGKLHALCVYLEGNSIGPPPVEWSSLRLVRFEWSGNRWVNRGTYLENCMNNYPPQMLNGRLLMTCRDGNMRVHTALLGSGRWMVTALSGEPPHDKMSEPSWYADPHGVAHMIFRDGRRSNYLYRSISRDDGKTWSAPVRTNYPDAGSKNVTGRLSNGWYYLINNPSPRGRDPLAISFSRDGWTFERSLALRRGATEIRSPRRGKNPGFQYPQALERTGALWVIYCVNQEDVEISEFNISDFGLER
ncbi:MAG: exo-alpha-sialidase [Acidobacteriota bacterium]